MIPIKGIQCGTLCQGLIIRISLLILLLISSESDMAVGLEPNIYLFIIGK